MIESTSRDKRDQWDSDSTLTGPDWLARIEMNSGSDTARGERPLRRLQPGDRFEFRFTTTGRTMLGTLIGLRLGTAAVVIDGKEKERYYQTREGKEVILQQLGGIEYWSDGAAVRPLGEKRDISRWKADRAGILQDTRPDEGTEDGATEGSTEDTNMAVKVANLAKQVNDEPELTAGQVKERKVGEKKPKAPKELHDCLCGCGEKVTGRFRMGHDGRYYGLLNRVVNDKLKFNELPPKMQLDIKTKANAEKILAEHWSHRKPAAPSAATAGKK